MIATEAALQAAHLLGRAAALLDEAHPNRQIGDQVRTAFNVWQTHGGIKFSDTARAELSAAFAAGARQATADAKDAEPSTKTVRTRDLRVGMTLSIGFDERITEIERVETESKQGVRISYSITTGHDRRKYAYLSPDAKWLVKL